MRIVGSDELGRAVVSRPSGLEKLDIDEILRLRYVGMLSGPPEGHFLGSDVERSLGKNGNGLRTRWERTRHQLHGGHRDEALWREAYHEIGRLCAWLNLPSYVREEITRIYTNLKARGKTTEAGITIEEQLAKVAHLACVIHRLPRNCDDIEHDIKELYEHGVGKVPKEFVKAAKYMSIQFGTFRRGKREYLQTWKNVNGKMAEHRTLRTLNLLQS